MTTPGDLREAALKVTTLGGGGVGWPPDVVDMTAPEEEDEVVDWAVEVRLDDAVATRTKLGVPLPPPEAPIKNTQGQWRNLANVKFDVYKGGSKLEVLTFFVSHDVIVYYTLRHRLVT